MAIDYNDIDDIIERMKALAFEGTVLKRRQLRGELLFILKFTKCPPVKWKENRESRWFSRNIFGRIGVLMAAKDERDEYRSETRIWWSEFLQVRHVQER